MSDRWSAVIAVATVVAALWAPEVPFWVAFVVMAVAVVSRRPAVLAIGVVLLVGGRADESLTRLGQPVAGRVDGVAQLVSDPEPQRYGTQVVLRLDGRRYIASAGFAHAAVLDRLLTGDLVRVSGRARPLRGAPLGWVRSRHLAGRLDVQELEQVAGTPPWYRVANAVHRTLTAGSASFGEERASLYTGLVMGDDRGQSELMQFRFSAAGLTHLLAVSGQNVAFLLAVAGPGLRRLGPRSRVVAAVVVLAVFALVTRGEPSVLRATVMAAIALTAVSLGRIVPGMRVLALTVTVLLVLDPLLVHSVGFQLSVAATAGLILLVRPLAQRLPGPDWLTLPVSVTVAAQLATAPVLVPLTGGLPAAATPANLLAVPAAGVVMMLGVTVGAVAGLTREPVAQVLQVPAGVLVRWIDWVAEVASRSPLPVLGPPRLVLLAVAAALIVVSLRCRGAPPSRRLDRRLDRGIARTLVALAVGCTLLALRPAAPAVGEHPLVDGASLWVGECGARVVTLGAVTDERELLEALWTLGVRRIDVAAVDSSATGARVALMLREQFEVRRTVTVAARAAEGVDPIGDSVVSVGGLRVTRGADSAVVRVSEAACSL